jgi:hypothetical protein
METRWSYSRERRCTGGGVLWRLRYGETDGGLGAVYRWRCGVEFEV